MGVDILVSVWWLKGAAGRGSVAETEVVNFRRRREYVIQVEAVAKAAAANPPRRLNSGRERPVILNYYVRLKN